MTLSRDPIPPKKGPRPTLGCGPFPFPPILCALLTPLRTASGPPLSAGGRSLPGILSPGPICLSIIDNSRPPLCRTAIEGPANSVVFRRKTGRTPTFSSEPPHSPHPEAKYQHFLPPSKHSLIYQKICEPDRLFARNRQKSFRFFRALRDIVNCLTSQNLYLHFVKNSTIYLVNFLLIYFRGK